MTFGNGERRGGYVAPQGGYVAPQGGDRESDGQRSPRWMRLIYFGCALVAFLLFGPWWCARDADAWFRGDVEQQSKLAADLIAFEAEDDLARTEADSTHEKHFDGRWGLLTHEMTAIGLAQVAFTHPELKDSYAPVITRASLKSFLPEMRDFGTKEWRGEDALKSLDGAHGHAYLARAALAIGLARWLDPHFPSDVAKQHDALIQAYERRLLASPMGLIETYPGEAYPADVAAVAAAIAIHGRATGAHHERVLAHWADKVRTKQRDAESGFMIQRMDAHDGTVQDVARGSGTASAAYFAGFADRGLAKLLADGLLRHASGLGEFGLMQEYEDGRSAFGDIASAGPVLFGISIAATGSALAPARALGRREEFTRIYRTTVLLGAPHTSGERTRFLAGGPIGNSLLLALLTSNPEISP